MRSCSVCHQLEIVPGTIADYKRLLHYHYRDSRPGPFAAIFALRPNSKLATSSGIKTCGVIVYTTPSPGIELRTIATGGLLTGFDKSTQLALVNKTIRCISRVIIEPRFRGLGLASRLVRETMPRVNVPIVEALAVMGWVNPFFERAGMKPYQAELPARCVQLIEALSTVGIEEQELIDAEYVQQKLEQLPRSQAEFIKLQIENFLHRYRKRHDMTPGIIRTRYILSKLTFRPVYYIWFNPGIFSPATCGQGLPPAQVRGLSPKEQP